MKYVFNVQLGHLSREEFNSQFKDCSTNLILGLAFCNIVSNLYLIIQLIIEPLLLFPILIQIIKSTIPFGLTIEMLNSVEGLLFLQYKELPVGISVKSAVIIKCLKTLGAFMCWLFVAIVYL